MTFPPLTSAADATLHWRQPERLQLRWVLASADQEFGVVESTDNEFVHAETASGTWRFMHQSSAMVAIRAGETEAEASLMMTDRFFLDRAEFRGPEGLIGIWSCASRLRGTIELYSPTEELWQTFRSGTDEGGVAAWWRTQCRVDFTPPGLSHPKRDLLCCMGWWLARGMERGIAAYL